MGIEGQNTVKKMELELTSMLSLLEEYKNTLERKADVKELDQVVSISYIYMLEKEILGILLKYKLAVEDKKENFEELIQEKFKLAIDFDSMNAETAISKMKEDLKKLNDSYKDKKLEKDDDVF